MRSALALDPEDQEDEDLATGGAVPDPAEGLLQSLLAGGGQQEEEPAAFAGSSQAPVPVGAPITVIPGGVPGVGAVPASTAAPAPVGAPAAPVGAPAAAGPRLAGGVGGYPPGFQPIQRVPGLGGPAARPTPVGEPYTPEAAGEPPKPEAPGLLDVAARGAYRLFEDAQQVAAVAKGEEPKPSETAQEDYEQPMTWSDFTDPKMLFKKMVFGATRSGAQIPAAMLGGLAGGAAGTAVGGVPGAAVGSVAMAAAAAGAVGFVQELGTAYSAELQKTPDDKEGAWDKAYKTAEKAGLISGLSMAMFGGPALFKSMLKGQFGVAAKAEAAGAAMGMPEAGRAAAAAALKDTRGIPERAVTQVLGQAGAIAAPTAAFNIAEGKPAGEGIVEALPGAVVNAATAGLGLAGRRGLERYAGKPGVGADQEAALAQANPPPVTGSEEFGPPAPPRAPAPLPIPPAGAQPGLPGIPTGEPPLQRPQGVTGQASLPLERPDMPPRPEVPPVPRPGEAQGELPGVIRPQEQPEIPGLGEPQGPRQNQMPIGEGAIEPVGRGREEPVPRELPPAGAEPGARGPVGPPPSMTRTPEGWSIEPDHGGFGYVVKAADGHVIAVGDTAAQAHEFARARNPDTLARPREGAAPEEPPPSEGPTTPPPPGGAGGGIKIGDLVQWTSGGQDQFQTPRRVTGILGDTHIQVEGSKTGIPIDELKVVERGKAEVPPTGEPVKPAPTGEPAGKAEPPPAKGAPAGEGVPSQITNAMKRELRDRGHTAEEIRNMTPAQAQEILSKPATTKGGKLREEQAAKKKPEPAKPAPEPEPAGEEMAPHGTKPSGYMTPETLKAIQGGGGLPHPIAIRRDPTGGWTMEYAEGPMKGTKVPFSGIVAGVPNKGMIPVHVTPEGYVQRIAEAPKPTPPPKPVPAKPAPARREPSAADKRKAAAEREAAKKPSPKGPRPTPDHQAREARRLLDEVLAGRMKPAEAHAAYGSGASRLYETFRDFVSRTLERARDPKIREGVLAQVERINKMQEEGRISPEEYRKAMARASQVLKHQEGLAKNEKRLQQILGELPEGRVAAESVMRQTRSTEARAKAVADTIQLRVGEQILAALKTGKGRLHDMLDTIINSPYTKLYARQHKVLAEILRKALPDLDVHDYAKVDPFNTSTLGQYRHEEWTGIRKPERIYLSGDALARARARQDYNPVTVLLHETLHAATLRYVQRIFSKPPSELTARELVHKTALQEVSKEMQRIARSGVVLPGDTAEHLAYSQRTYPPFNQPHELITQIFTSPQLHKLLSETKASKPLLDALKLLDLAPQPGIVRRAATSVFDAFRTVIESVFGIPRDSVLDAVWRPLTQITEAGIGYRDLLYFADRAKYAAEFEKGLPVQQIVQNRANSHIALDLPVDSRISAGTERLKRANTDLGDPAKRTLMRGEMLGSHLDSIVNHAKRVFQIAAKRNEDGTVEPARNALIDHREAKERVTATAAGERDRFVERPDGTKERVWQRVDRLAKQFWQSPDAEKLGDLMNEVRRNEASMVTTNPADNAHVDPDVLHGLQEKFNNLTPQEQQTWREIVAHNNEINLRERDAYLEGQINRAFPDIAKPAREALAQQVRTRAGIDALLGDMDNNPVAEAFGAEWGRSRRFARLIAEGQRVGMTRGDYFAARRYGNYIFRWGDPGTDTYGTRFFESKWEADKAHAAAMLEPDKFPDLSAVFDKTRSESKLMLPDKSLAELDGALNDLNLPEATQTALREAFIGRMLQHGTATAEHRMAYEGVLGASTDQGRALNHDFLAHSYRMGHLKHDGEVYQSLFDMNEQARLLSHDPARGNDARLARLTHEELLKRMAPIDGDTTADILGKSARSMTALTALYGLIRPAHLVYNLMDSHATASSLLSGRHGAGGVLAISRAIGQLTGTALRAGGRNALHLVRGELDKVDWNMSHLYRDRLIDAGMSEEYAKLLTDRLDASSLVNVTPVRELRRMAGPKGFFGDLSKGVGPKIMDMLSMGEHAVDSMSRMAIAKAAFDLELGKLGNNLENAKKAAEYATEIARTAMPNVNPHNKPRILTGHGPLNQFAAPIMQYKSYGLQMYAVMANLARDAYHKGGAERTEAVTALAAMMGSHALMSGVGATIFGSLPMMIGLGLYDFFGDPESKRPHTNQELEAMSRNWVRAQTGSKTAADVMDRGLGMLGGVDSSRSLTFSNMVGVPELRSYDKAGGLEWLASVATGASSDTIGTMAAGIKRAINGDWKGLISVLPRVVRDPVQAYGLATEGLKNQAGTQQILPANQIPAYQIGLKAAGFIPEATSTAQAGRHIESLHVQTVQDAHAALLDNYMRATDKREAWKAIARYNASNPYDQIQPSAITRRISEAAKGDLQPGTFGLHVPAKQAYPLSRIAAFAQP